MLKILFKDGTEIETLGRVKFYDYDQDEALCNNYDFKVELLTNSEKDNIKIAYDTETLDFVYIHFCSMVFYKDEKYPEMYAKAIEEINLIKKFKREFQIWVDVGQLDIDINDLAEWAIFEREKIISILEPNKHSI